LALVSLLRRRGLSRRSLRLLLGLAIFGAALFLGDSMITPAISILSSVEGLKDIDPGLDQFVVPAAIVILALLIVVQRRGSSRVGAVFGPVMALWFLVLAILGAVSIVREPSILRGLSPTWGIDYFVHDPLTAFLSLGGVVLVVTGAEALYADLGHFGRRQIAWSWMGLVFPALVVNYLGQGALLLRDPDASSSPLLGLAPHWSLMPLVLLATAATIIASQAVISGAFSVASQAMRLGYLPHVRIIHTSATESRQVYVPLVNAILGVGVLALVVTFQSSEKLAAAYGLAVTGTMTISTILYFVIRWTDDRWPRWLVGLTGTGFVTLVGTLLLANVVKIPQGGWLPITIAVVFFGLLTTWHRGRELTADEREGAEGSLEELVESVRQDDDAVVRVPGCGVFLTRSGSTAPIALRANLDHNHALHASTILLTVVIEELPRVIADDQVTVTDLGYRSDGISHVSVRLGYLDPIRLDALLGRALDLGAEADRDDLEHASYFFSVPEYEVTGAPGMMRWRKHLFVSMERLAPDPVHSFKLPHNRAVVMGADVEF
jgi:KUP system potassium uptake protein